MTDVFTDNITPIATVIIILYLLFVAIPVALYRTCMRFEEDFHQTGD